MANYVSDACTSLNTWNWLEHENVHANRNGETKSTMNDMNAVPFRCVLRIYVELVFLLAAHIHQHEHEILMHVRRK